MSGIKQEGEYYDWPMRIEVWPTGVPLPGAPDPKRYRMEISPHARWIRLVDERGRVMSLTTFDDLYVALYGLARYIEEQRNEGNQPHSTVRDAHGDQGQTL